MFHAQKLALELLENNESINIDDDKLMIPFFMLSEAVANDDAHYAGYDNVKQCKPMLLELMSAMVRNHRGDDFVFHHVCDVLVDLLAQVPALVVDCEPQPQLPDLVDQKTVAAGSEAIYDRCHDYIVILGIWLWKLVKLIGIVMLGLLVFYVFLVGMRFTGALFGRWPMSREAIFDCFYMLR